MFIIFLSLERDTYSRIRVNKTDNNHVLTLETLVTTVYKHLIKSAKYLVPSILFDNEHIIKPMRYTCSAKWLSIRC
jgi:hypothetical protein